MRILFCCIFSVLISQTEGVLTKCSKPVDIVFAIDTSASIWIVNFPSQIQFVRDVVSELNIGSGIDKSRVAVVTFSKDVKLVFDFNQGQDTDAVVKAIDEIVHDKGDATRTYKALQLVHEQVLAPGNGERPEVENVVVVLTDGVTNSGGYDSYPNGGKDQTLDDARTVRNLPAHLFAIGIGHGVNMEELKHMASIPDTTYVITANDFEELNTDNIKQKLINRTCEVVVPQATTPPTPATTTTPPPKEEPKECYEARADIFFVLDQSSSIQTRENFQKELEFVREVIDRIETGPTKAQVGLMKFSTDATTEFHLGDHTTKTDLVNAVSMVNWEGGNTNTDKAINLLIDRGFNKIFGARENVPQIAIFLTDGWSTKASLTEEAIERLQETDIISFAIGVGENKTDKMLEELKSIATSPDHFFEVDNLDRLVDIRKNFVDVLCEDAVDTDEEKPQKNEECKESIADIMFLLDGSTSINNKETFDKELDFIISVIDEMDIGQTKTQIALMQFASGTKIEFLFNEHDNKADLAAAIRSARWMQGNTYLNLALDKIVQVSTKENGFRDNVPHILVLISDGVSTRRSYTMKAIERLREKTDYVVFGIGVGMYLNMDELSKLVSKPVPDHQFHVDNQDSLPLIRSQLTTRLCAADEPKPAPEVCIDKKADIIFIADASTSIGITDFGKLKSFMKKVISNFEIGTDKIQIGLVTFSNSSKTEFPLKAYSSSDELDKAIDGVHYTQGLTFTHLALEEVLKHGFTAQAGARDDVPRIVVIVTDGWSRDPTNTLINAQKAKDAGIIMFSIGVGNYLDEDELKAMSSDPVEIHSFMVEDYSALESIQNSVASKVCTVNSSVRPVQPLIDPDRINSIFGPKRKSFKNQNEEKELKNEIEHLDERKNDRRNNLASRKENLDQEDILSFLEKALKRRLDRQN
ncbi:collagen alpha-5(VI) chain-like [Mytilus edulis]|uniref:collagen alpha-5(VI) chain-like n=1 Tax=Mytilus edulis TaxID=6550 RepID=UPI0039EEDC40